MQDENEGTRLTPRFSDAAAGSLTMLYLDWEDKGHRLSGNKGETKNSVKVGGVGKELKYSVITTTDKGMF